MRRAARWVVFLLGGVPTLLLLLFGLGVLWRFLPKCDEPHAFEFLPGPECHSLFGHEFFSPIQFVFEMMFGWPGLVGFLIGSAVYWTVMEIVKATDDVDPFDPPDAPTT